MKKVLLMSLFIGCLLCFTGLKSYADTQVLPCKIIVKTTEDLSSNNIQKNFKVIVNDTYKLPNGKYAKKDTELYLETVKVNPESRGQRNANVQAKIRKVYIPSENKTIEINDAKTVVTISAYEKLDNAGVVGVAADAGIAVTSVFVKGIFVPAHFAKGAITDKSGNKLKAGAQDAYKASPFYYIEKGDALVVPAGSLLTMSFYLKDENTGASSTETTK